MANNTYVDTYGRSHVASKVLSSGGQGIVYKTEEPNTLLKLEWDPVTQKVIDDVSSNEKFDDIRILPLLEKTNLTLPQAILRDVAGYTMRLLDDMKSFDEVFSAEGQEKIQNNWLKEIEESDAELASVFEQYISSGGIRKRLKSYLKAACVLAKIHASGLVYCDVSDKNMFVSVDANNDNVWLIDCDNLDYMKNTAKRNGWMTAGFGAPEIYQGKGNTMYSDAYSFAIALFWTLTNKHPFMGEAVEEVLQEEDMLDETEENYACSGKFAWIGDEDDVSNHSETGIPYNMFLSNSLHNCFNMTFSEEGRINRQKRITMPEWCFILAKNLDGVVRCDNCGMDYYAHESSTCPWCDAENKLIHIATRKECNGLFINHWDFVHEQQNEKIDIPMRILAGFNSNQIDDSAFQVQYSKDELVIDGLSNQYEFAMVLGGKEKQLYGQTITDTKSKIKIISVCKKSGVRYEIEIEV